MRLATFRSCRVTAPSCALFLLQQEKFAAEEVPVSTASAPARGLQQKLLYAARRASGRMPTASTGRARLVSGAQPAAQHAQGKF